MVNINNTNHLLEKGSSLPPSTLGREFVDVKRTMVVHYNENDLEEHMKDLGDGFWKDSSSLRAKFKIPVGTFLRQRIPRPVKLNFPYCLLASTSTLRERLIVINWWINLSHVEQQAKRDFLKTKFEKPSVSAIRIYEYDRSNPNYIGVADSLALRGKAASNSRSYQIVSGGTKRKSASAPARSNRQVRDMAVKSQQATTEREFKALAQRSAVDENFSSGVDGYYHPILLTMTNVKSPEKQARNYAGRPKLSATLMETPKVTHFSRNEHSLGALATHLVKQLEQVSVGKFKVPKMTMLAALKAGSNQYFSEDKETKWPSDILYESRKSPAGTVPGLTAAENAGREIFSCDTLSSDEE